MDLISMTGWYWRPQLHPSRIDYEDESSLRFCVKLWKRSKASKAVPVFALDKNILSKSWRLESMKWYWPFDSVSTEWNINMHPEQWCVFSLKKGVSFQISRCEKAMRPIYCILEMHFLHWTFAFFCQPYDCFPECHVNVLFENTSCTRHHLIRRSSHYLPRTVYILWVMEWNFLTVNRFKMIIQVWSPMATFPKNFPTPLPLVKVRWPLMHRDSTAVPRKYPAAHHQMSKTSALCEICKKAKGGWLRLPRLTPQWVRRLKIKRSVHNFSIREWY